MKESESLQNTKEEENQENKEHDSINFPDAFKSRRLGSILRNHFHIVDYQCERCIMPRLHAIFKIVC